MKQTKFLSILLFLTFAYITAQAQVPKTISYQGILTNAEGNAVSDGDYSIVFTLYNALTDGNNLWTETQTVTVTNGIFNVILGSVTPLDLSFSTKYWLGLTIESGDELTPRTELTSTPYSLNTSSIPNQIVTGEKVADGNLVRSINGLKDDVTLTAGSNVNISETGNVITISATGGSGTEGVASVDGVSNNGGNIDLVAGSNVTITPDDANNKITISASGGSSGDNLGNHTAIQNIKLSNHWLSGDGGNEGVYVHSTGKVGIGTNNPLVNLDVSGTLRATTIRVGNPVSSYGSGDIAAVNNIYADDNIGTRSGYIRAGTPSVSYGNGDIAATDEVIADNTIRTGSPSSSYGSGDIVATDDLLADDDIVAKTGSIVTGTPSVSYGNGDIAATDEVIADNTIRTGSPSSSYGSGDIVATDDLICDDILFANNKAIINAPGAGSTSYILYVGGAAYSTESWNTSDKKYKKNIAVITNPITQLKKLKGVSFDWRVDEFKEQEFSKEKQFGLIAQEVEKVFPNLVKTDENGEKAVNYIGLIPILLESIKAQQKEIDELRNLLNN